MTRVTAQIAGFTYSLAPGQHIDHRKRGRKPMNFSDMEIATAVRVQIAKLDNNNDLPVVLKPLDLEIDTERHRLGTPNDDQ